MARRPFPRGGIRTRLPVTIYRRSSDQLHPDAQDWVNRVYSNGGTVSSATAAAVNQFCVDLENAPGGSIRDRFYRLNLFAGNSDASLNAVRTPLFRGPSLGGTQYGGTTDTNNNFLAADYNETGASGGLLGNGTTKYLDTGFNVSSLPGAANCHLSGYIRGTQSVSGAGTLIGALFNGTADRYRIFLLENNASTYAPYAELGKAVNVNTTRSNANGGLFLASRTSTTSLTFYDDAVSIGTNTSSTVEDATGNVPFLVFARSGPTDYLASRMAGYSIGAGMTGAQVTSYYNALNTFQTALGRNQS